ncbi:hypothetical protein [Persicobacter diffluens]|uniref:Plasmid transfer protein n=1 Tax=Persicobacter diffluens TaxID=981 RepID=A0AAN4W2X6_9BACT|nr:plasmid transfer protein [Persicobacter diffluens]
MFSFSELFDLEFLKFIREIRNIFGYTELMEHARYGRYLAGVFTMLFMAVKSYGMIVGDRDWEIMPLLRPFAIGLVIINWGSFLIILDGPLNGLSRLGEVQFERKIETIKADHKLVRDLSVELSMKLLTGTLEVNGGSEKEEKGFFEKLGVDLSRIGEMISGAGILIVSLLKQTARDAGTDLAHSFYQIAFYLILIIQQVFLVMLGLLGPYAFAMSILPGFSDSYIQWIARYISVSLYSFVAYTIALMSMFMMDYANRSNISALQQILDNEEHYISYVHQMNFSMSLPAMSFIIGALLMFTVPTVSTWIVSTSGLGNALGNVIRAGHLALTAGSSGAVKAGAALNKLTSSPEN